MAITLSEFHSPQQKRDISSAARWLVLQSKFHHKLAYLILAELARHADPFFLDVLEYLDRTDKDSRTQNFRKLMHQEFEKTYKIVQNFEKYLSDSIVQDLLTPNKPVLLRRDVKNKPLIVVFTTMYNNFYLSNLTLVSLLLEGGYSVLMLKDGSGLQYLNGIPELGKDWDQSMVTLDKIVRKEGKGLIVTGFSSGGYASILASLTLKPDLYVGWSVCGNLARSSSLPMPKLFTENLREQTPEHLRRDLVPEVNQMDLRMRLFAGNEHPRDLCHMRSFKKVKNVDMYAILGEGHISVRSPFLAGTLIDAYAI
jgi:hypothetical protein